MFLLVDKWDNHSENRCGLCVVSVSPGCNQHFNVTQQGLLFVFFSHSWHLWFQALVFPFWLLLCVQTHTLDQWKKSKYWHSLYNKTWILHQHFKGLKCHTNRNRAHELTLFTVPKHMTYILWCQHDSEALSFVNISLGANNQHDPNTVIYHITHMMCVGTHGGKMYSHWAVMCRRAPLHHNGAKGNHLEIDRNIHLDYRVPRRPQQPRPRLWQLTFYWLTVSS